MVAAIETDVSDDLESFSISNVSKLQDETFTLFVKSDQAVQTTLTYHQGKDYRGCGHWQTCKTKRSIAYPNSTNPLPFFVQWNLI